MRGRTAGGISGRAGQSGPILLLLRHWKLQLQSVEPHQCHRRTVPGVPPGVRPVFQFALSYHKAAAPYACTPAPHRPLGDLDDGPANKRKRKPRDLEEEDAVMSGQPKVHTAGRYFFGGEPTYSGGRAWCMRGPGPPDKGLTVVDTSLTVGTRMLSQAGLKLKNAGGMKDDKVRNPSMAACRHQAHIHTHTYKGGMQHACSTACNCGHGAH